jgi:hypothetical protein
MDRFKVTLREEDREERRALRTAFAKGHVIEFRGRHVSVWGEFVHGANGSPAEYVFELQPESQRPHRAAAASDPGVMAQMTVTLDQSDREELETLQDGFFRDTVVHFRGRHVRVLREFMVSERSERVWTFELAVIAG